MSETHQVRLTDVSGDVDAVVRAVRDTTGLDEDGAGRIVETRGVVEQGVDRAAVAELCDRFESANADVAVEPTRITSATTPAFEPPTPPGQLASAAQTPGALAGRVVDARNPDRGVPGAGVVAFAADGEDALGSTVTNEDGAFVVESFGDAVTERYPDERPEVEFNAFLGDDELELSYVPFDWGAFEHGGTVTLRVHATGDGSALPTTDSGSVHAGDGSFGGDSVVTGTVRIGGEPCAGVTVRAFDADLRHERELGEARTDAEGRYEIRYGDGGDGPMRWRRDRGRLDDWLDTLETRTEARDVIETQIEDAVAAAERTALPEIRDWLVENVSVPDAVPGDERAEWSTERLLLDVETDACRQITRVAAAVESIQTLVFAVDRTGTAGGLGDLDLRNVDDAFEERWRWLGTYPKWKSALGVYLSPENVLLPTIRSQRSAAFDAVVEDLGSGGELPPRAAGDAIEQHASYVEDVCTMRPECGCLLPASGDVALAHDYDGDYVGYAFGSGADDHFYWRPFDPSRDAPERPAGLWHPLEPEDLDITSVVDVVGYGSTMYLFVRAKETDKENNEYAPGYLTYDVRGDDGWSEFTELELPDSSFSGVELELVYGEGTDHPPELVIEVPGWNEYFGHDYYFGQFDSEGNPPGSDDYDYLFFRRFVRPRDEPLRQVTRHGDHRLILLSEPPGSRGSAEERTAVVPPVTNTVPSWSAGRPPTSAWRTSSISGRNVHRCSPSAASSATSEGASSPGTVGTNSVPSASVGWPATVRSGTSHRWSPVAPSNANSPRPATYSVPSSTTGNPALPDQVSTPSSSETVVTCSPLSASMPTTALTNDCSPFSSVVAGT